MVMVTMLVIVAKHHHKQQQQQHQEQHQHQQQHQQPAAPECLWKADSWTNANRQPGSEKPPLPGLFRACLSRKCPPRKAAFLLHTETNGHLYCMFMVTSTLICEVYIYD